MTTQFFLPSHFELTLRKAGNFHTKLIIRLKGASEAFQRFSNSNTKLMIDDVCRKHTGKYFFFAVIK